jgi:GNAT superfamily N-acetyltransferase
MTRDVYPNRKDPLWAKVLPAGERPQYHLQGHPVGSLVFNVAKYEIYEGIDKRGEATLVKPATGDYYLTRLQVEEEYRGQGIGTAAIILAAEAAHYDRRNLRTDPTGEYASIANLWERLVHKGVAEVIEPLSVHRPSGQAENSVLLMGHLQIPQPGAEATSTN